VDYNDWENAVGGELRVNVPNLLTLCRFALIPVYILVFVSGHLPYAFAVIVLAGATDILDGYWARTRGQITEVGKMLDPLADKTLMIVVMVTLLASGMIGWAAAVAIFLRDIGMIIGSAILHFRGMKTVPANTLGKLTTVLYYVAIMLIFFEAAYAETVLWCAIVVSYIASFIYIGQFRLINQRRSI
jgi:cardiolipin synthase